MKMKWFAPLTILASIVIIVSVISWYAFPAWRDVQGGRWQLLGIVIVATLPIAKDVLGFVKEWNTVAKPNDEEQNSSKSMKTDPSLASIQGSGQKESGAAGKAAMRALLLDSLREQELREIISDYFPDLFSTISSRSNPREIIAELIEFACKRRQVKLLLEIVDRYNPRQYRRYQKGIDEIMAGLSSEE
jgi:hypothetical protein